MRMLRALAELCLILLFIVITHRGGREASAQSVQAVRGLSQDISEASLQPFIDSLRSRRIILAALVNLPPDRQRQPGIPQLMAAGQIAFRDAERALNSRNDPEAFVAYYRDFVDSWQAVLEHAAAARAQAAGNQQATEAFDSSRELIELERAAQERQQIKSAIPVPAHLVVPEVVFTSMLGAEAQIDQKVIGSATLSTNLVGVAFGEAFQAIGSDALKQYLTDNLTVGVDLPFNGEEVRLGNQLGIGLGTVRLSKGPLWPINGTIWPLLGFRQLPAGDPRIPSAVSSASPDASFSSPMLGFAFFPGGMDKWVDKFCRTGFAWIVSFSVTLPYYHEGSTFDALGDLFTAKVEDFDRAGKLGFGLGISFPLLPIKPRAQTTTGEPAECK